MKKFILSLAVATLIAGCAAPKKEALKEPVFYPPLPEQPRLQYLTRLSSEDDLKRQSSFEEFLIGKQVSSKNISRPYDIAAVKGKIYVSDRDHNSVIVIDIENEQFDYIPSKGLGAIYKPAGIWVAEDNHLYIADFGRQQVLVFDSDNQFVRSYGEAGELEKPLDVVVYDENIYVCDYSRHHIVVFDKESGDIVNTIGSLGDEDGMFRSPSHLTVNKWGDLFVMDSFNFRVQKFDLDGNHIRNIGYHGDTFGGFARPKGISIDREAHLYAVDIAFENVQIFDDETGRLLLFFGVFGFGPGQMYLPGGVFVDYSNVDYFKKYADKDFRIAYVVYVANALGPNKINVYGFGDWVGTPLPEIK